LMLVRRKEFTYLPHIIKNNRVFLFALQFLLDFFYRVLPDTTTLKKKSDWQENEKRKLFSKRYYVVVPIHLYKINLRV
jgi:hypothetical protein